MVASPQRKRRASCSWCSILNFFKAGSTEVFSHRDSRFSLRYAPSGHSKALNQRRKSDFGTVFRVARAQDREDDATSAG